MEEIPPCPHLPDADRSLSAVSIRSVGEDRGEAFYLRALECAQALWIRGLPAQAVLMINRALSADLGGGEDVLNEWPPPYRALRWILEHHGEDHFIGNPRRHFQHLATRMSGPRGEVRIWRAWACWRIACLVNPDDPADEKQIIDEGIDEPDECTIRDRLDTLGWKRETEAWRSGCQDSESPGAF